MRAENAAWELFQAEQLRLQGKTRQARALLEQAARDNRGPSLFRVYLKLAQLYYQAGELEPAREALLKAIPLAGKTRQDLQNRTKAEKLLQHIDAKIKTNPATQQ